MANNCFFSMRASGTTEAVDRVIDFLNTHHYDGCDIEDANDMYLADGYEKTMKHMVNIPFIMADMLNSFSISMRQKKYPYTTITLNSNGV